MFGKFRSGQWSALRLGMTGLSLAMILSLCHAARAQTNLSSATNSTAHAKASAALESRIDQLNTSLDETRDELKQSRQELKELRQALRDLQLQLAAFKPVVSEAPQLSQSALAPSRNPQAEGMQKEEMQKKEDQGLTPARDESSRLEELEEGQAWMQAEQEQQEQAKVESSSKYRVKLSGLLLFNAFGNFGFVDNLDSPYKAVQPTRDASNKSIGATMRQTILGLQGNGPRLWGARSSADVHFDFFGGFPTSDFGRTAGLVRLRTGNIRLDWKDTSLIVGQDAPFFSPLSPTSLASVGQPALSWAGNLWTWTPQIRVEHRTRVTANSTINVEGGLLDPLDPGPPPTQTALYQGYTEATHGERTGNPGYATRLSWRHASGGDPSTLGIGGFFSPQSYSSGRKNDAWAGTADWKIPVSHFFQISGELYRGKSVGGLGGGISNSMIINGDPKAGGPYSVALNSVGAWIQLKFRVTPRFEINGAAGQDNPFAKDLERFAVPQGQETDLKARNRTAFVNLILKPKSNLLFSLEFRHIQSFSINGQSNVADHLNLAAGYIF